VGIDCLSRKKEGDASRSKYFFGGCCGGKLPAVLNGFVVLKAVLLGIVLVVGCWQIVAYYMIRNAQKAKSKNL
jgi:hypothetical protein